MDEKNSVSEENTLTELCLWTKMNTLGKTN